MFSRTFIPRTTLRHLRFTSTKASPPTKTSHSFHPIPSLTHKTIPPTGTTTLSPSIAQAATSTKQAIETASMTAGTTSVLRTAEAMDDAGIRLANPHATQAPRIDVGVKGPVTGTASDDSTELPTYEKPTAASLIRNSPFVKTLSSHPGTSTVTFLLLHEVTALIPLVAITGALHYTDPIPLSSLSTSLVTTFAESLDTFSLYFAKHDFFGFSLTPDGHIVGREAWNTMVGIEPGVTDASQVTITEEAMKRYKLVSHIAMAYVVTKILLPVRVWVSAAMTPAVVRWSMGGWDGLRAWWGRWQEEKKREHEEDEAEERKKEEEAEKAKTKVVRKYGIPRKERVE